MNETAAATLYIRPAILDYIPVFQSLSLDSVRVQQASIHDDRFQHQSHACCVEISKSNIQQLRV